MLIILLITFSVNVLGVKFYSINALNGTSIRATNSICKDDNGFIWASSKTGILRLTDDDYRIYQLPNETVGAIMVKLVYEKSKLIAYTNNGQIFKYNPVYDRFELIFNLNNEIKNTNFEIYNILIGESGNFWIGLSSGLYKFHEGELTLVGNFSAERYSATWFDQQQILIAGADGISMVDIHSLKIQNLYDVNEVRPFSVSSVLFDKTKNKLWMGSLSNGLFCYDLNSNSLSNILKTSIPKQPILAIEENSDSTLLIGIDGQGIWELNKNSEKLLNVFKESADDPNSLPGNGVYDILYESGKRVWICTISGGVSFYEIASPIVTQISHNANNYNSLANNDVNAIIEDRSGKIWFATNNGISCWNTASNQWQNFYNNKMEQAQVFLTLCEDNQGRIWAGSYSTGFYVLDANTGKELAHYFRNEKTLPTVSDFIFDITKDSDGDLWIGGIFGDFVCFLNKENKFETYTELPISSFTEISPDQILIGFSYGISLLNKVTGDITNLLSGILVQDILVLGDIIWVCTSGEGLMEYNYKTGETTKFTTQSGLPSNFLNSILFDNNYLWIGTENGLCRFNPEDKTTLTFQSIFPLSGVSYNKSSAFKLKNGQMAWGTNNGVFLFEAESLKEIPLSGRIYFQDLTVSGRSVRDISTFQLTTPVDSLKSIDLKYFQNTISIELLSIGIPQGAKFSWKLEGFDKDWSAATSNRIITYTNLPSGKFTLRIKLLDNSMSKVINERSIAIRLIPPFWRKSWFWGILLIVVLGVLFLYILLYINSLKQKHTEEKVRFFTNTAHDIRTALTLIKAPVEELSHEKNLSDTGKQYLQIALNQARQLSSVVTQLMDFQKVDIGKEITSLTMVDMVKLISDRCVMYESFSKSRNIHIEFVTDRNNYVTAVDETKIEKVIDNLISNAVKYSPNGGRVSIEFKADKGKWILNVKDNGIGISKKAQRKLFKEFYRGENAINSKIVGSGIGLLLVKNYITIHSGTISCESQKNVGSRFQVIIPFSETNAKERSIQLANETESKFDFTNSIISETEHLIENNSSKKMSVLITEDNDDLRNFIAYKIGGEFTTLVAEDGGKAWKLILEHTPDLIISDVMMPVMNGFELCKRVKSTYETSHIPVILLTALSDKTTQLHGLGLGADDYLTKPFDMNLLIQKIKTILHNREVVREKALKLINKDISEPLFTNELNDKFVKKMLEVASANIANTEFYKDEFALSMNVSTSLLYKKIKSLTNQSPSDFMKTVRLNHALKFLQSRKHTITEVSELCGFTSPAYFSTVFKKHYGKSPSEILD